MFNKSLVNNVVSISVSILVYIYKLTKLYTILYYILYSYNFCFCFPTYDGMPKSLVFGLTTWYSDSLSLTRLNFTKLSIFN